MIIEPFMESSLKLPVLVTVAQDSRATGLCPWSGEGRNYIYTSVSSDTTDGQSAGPRRQGPLEVKGMRAVQFGRIRSNFRRNI
jgi:hypothetical protein